MMTKKKRSPKNMLVHFVMAQVCVIIVGEMVFALHVVEQANTSMKVVIGTPVTNAMAKRIVEFAEAMVNVCGAAATASIDATPEALASTTVTESA